MSRVFARSLAIFGIALPVLSAACGCAGGSLVSSPIAPASTVAEVWRSAPTQWFLEAPIIEVREEIGGARRALVPTPGAAGAEAPGAGAPGAEGPGAEGPGAEGPGAEGPQDPSWRQGAGEAGTLMRELADRASGTRVVERATVVRAEGGVLVLERVVEVVELPAGFELSMQLPLSMRGPDDGSAGSGRRVEWTVHGAALGALWGEETHAVVLGRDEATRISLRVDSPPARAPR